MVAERLRVARGSRCARKRALAAHHERAQTDRRGRTSTNRVAKGGGTGVDLESICVALRKRNVRSGTTHQRNATRGICVALLRCAKQRSGMALTLFPALAVRGPKHERSTRHVVDSSCEGGCALLCGRRPLARTRASWRSALSSSSSRTPCNALYSARSFRCAARLARSESRFTRQRHICTAA